MSLKHWLKNRGRAFTSQAKAFGLEPPRGALLLGVPGCGKNSDSEGCSRIVAIPIATVRPWSCIRRHRW